MQLASDGGGGGSSFFAAEPAAVTAAGSALAGQAGAVGGGRSFGAVAGVGEAAGVEAAAAAFRAAWDGPLTAWQTSLNALGEATRGAATAIKGTDESGHQAWAAFLGGMS